ncbi:MAG TPA: hypothetical protein VFV66_25000 [Nonomuraea sp.]|nr:hypothetical protein [Nonomuraea sp.]
MSIPLTDHRLSWEDLPDSVHDRITAHYGRVDKAETVHGERPGFAGRVYAQRDDAFIKAVPLTAPSADLALVRSEQRAAEILHTHPEPTPAPVLLWTNTVDGWLILAWELINDHARHADLGPGSGDLPFVLDTLGWLAEEPITAHGRSAAEHYNRVWAAGRVLLDQPATLPNPRLYRGALDGFDVDRLDGASLVHTRLGRRSILVKDNQIFVVSWSHWCRGPWWIDLASLAPHFIAKGNTPEQTDEMLGAAVERWPEASAADVAGVAALEALHHRYLAEYGPKLRSEEEARLAVACHEWLAYWAAHRLPALT